MYNDLKTEINNLINKIEDFWGSKVSKIHVTESTDTPFNMFTIEMRLYQTFDVIMEYERSTLGISVKVNDKYIILSKLVEKTIFRGLQSYIPENLLYNFTVLDELLKSL